MLGDATFEDMGSTLPQEDPVRRAAAAPAPSLLRRVRAWAAVLLAARAALVFVSYALAPFAPIESQQPARLALLERLASAAPFGRAFLCNLVSGNSIFASAGVRAVTYLAIFALSATACAAVVRLLVRDPGTPDPRVMRALLWTAAGIAVLGLLRFPSFTNDFWMSVAWGRMILSGVNPYYNDFTAAAMRGVPFETFPLHMTYGPLWALLSAAMAWLAHGSLLVSYLLQKLLLAAAWLTTLLVVRRLGERRSPRHALVAVCLFGWLPASAAYAIGEGHNDVLVALGVSLFAVGVLERRMVVAGVALTASILVKYVTFPLALVAVLEAAHVPAAFRRRALVVAAACLTVAAGCFALFYRGPGFFSAVQSMRGWHFLTPATVAAYLLRLAGLSVPLRLLNAVALVALIAVAWVSLAAWTRRPDDRTATRFMLALLAMMLFGVVGHVWPWFTIWLLPLAALEWDTPLVWPVLAFVWCEPLLNLSWFLEPDLRLVEPLGAVAYGIAILVTLGLLARRRGTAVERAS